MSLPVYRRPAVEQDIVEHYRYIGERNRSAAEAFLKEVETSIELLSNMPRAGARCETIRNPRLPGLRRWLVHRFRNHVIYYLPFKDRIEIVRILHASRDRDSLLRLEK